VLLTGDAVVDGLNQGDVGISAVRVLTDGRAVTAQLCKSQHPIADPAQCIDLNGDEVGWFTYTGERSGATATVSVKDTRIDPGGLLWGTVVYSGPESDAPPIRFTSADNCERLNGTRAKVTDYNCE